MPEEHKKFLKSAKKAYEKIGSVSSPVFVEPIHFNKYGWNHLIRKGRKLRHPEEQSRRIKLIPTAISILSSTKSIKKYTLDVKLNSKVEFWEVVENEVHVILRRKNNSKLHFFSVF